MIQSSFNVIILHSVSRPAVAAGFMSSSGLNTLQRMLSHLLHSEEREWEALCPGLNVAAARESTAEPSHRHRCRCKQQLSHRDKNRNKNMEMVSIFVFQISYHENRAILISFCSNAFLTFIPVWKYVSTFGV